MDFSPLNEIEGLQFIPINNVKVPTVKEWQASQKKHDLSKTHSVGLVCGELSGHLEVIDVDCKYDLTGKMFDNYKRLVHEVDGNLLDKLVVQKTIKGGYHLIYRCSIISGNLKLANRPTTADEKKYTYDQTYKAELAKNPDDAKAKQIADKASKNDKVRVLFETRGEGGYIACFPSEGYTLLHRDFYGITEITPEERETILNIARQFNQVFEEDLVPKRAAMSKSKGISAFEDYNQRGDVVGLLEKHGWQIIKQKGHKTIFLRPGQTSAATSGNYDMEKNWFSVFTTSTEFEPQKAYLPYCVFALLECNKDFTEAYKRLLDLGYGEKDEPQTKEKTPSTRVIQSRIKVDDSDYSFLATGVDYDQYLQQVIDGTLPMGLTTGSPELDKYFLFKEGELIMTNGHDGTGKSVFTWWLLMLASMYHGWKGIIFSSENTLGSFMRKMIQFYWGKPMRGYNCMTHEEYLIAKTYVESNFKLIKAQEDLYNYKDVLNMIRKTKEKYPDFNHALIDPYNSLKTDLSGYSKLSTHEYHYEAISEIKSYGQLNKFGFFVNHHAVTEALRKVDKEGYPIAPNKADTEGGGKVPNKADGFLTIHRKTQHPENWGLTEVHVRKVKDTETGGRNTPLDKPVLFEMYRNHSAFREKTEMGYEVDPVQEWHRLKNGGEPRSIFRVGQSGDMRLPYKQDDEEIPDITF